MKACDFCGRELKLHERYFKMLDKRQCRLCRTCAENFEALSSSSSVKKIRSISWARYILANGLENEEIKSAFLQKLNEAEMSVR